MSKSQSKSFSWSSAGLWLPGLVVAISAAVATAHGLYEVVVVSGVPGSVAWTYPLITDGLAVVAYAATSRLEKNGRLYAWAVVILAAGLSGLAQALYFVGDFAAAVPADPGAPSGPGQAAPPPAGGVGGAAQPPPDELRFGVGAWPAIAAAIVAHLLFMLSERRRSASESSTPAKAPASAGPRPVPGEPSTAAVQPDPVQSAGAGDTVVQSVPVQSTRVQSNALEDTGHPKQAERPPHLTTSVQPDGASGDEPEPSRPERPAPSPKRDRALREARKHQALAGTLPTVDQLAEAADVSRGTAGTVLKELREQPHQLHVITDINTSKAHP